MNPESTTSGNDVHCCSEEARKMTWTREMRIRLFMQMERERCRNELGWLIRCPNTTVDSCSEEGYPPKPLPIPPKYTKHLERRMRKVMKGILPPTSKIILRRIIDYQHVQHPFIHSSRKFRHVCHHQWRALSLGRWGPTRPRARLLEHRQMDGKRIRWLRKVLRMQIRGKIRF